MSGGANPAAARGGGGGDGVGGGVVLAGFMGAGKSTVGPALAAALGLPFVDMDAVLAAAHGPVAEQLRADEASFRARERALAMELAAGPPAVVATGGGAWVDPEVRAVFAGRAIRVVLRAPLAVLRARVVGDGDGRPLARDPAQFAALHAARAEAYADADLSVATATDGGDVPVAEVVAAIVAAWGARALRAPEAVAVELPGEGPRRYVAHVAPTLAGLGAAVRAATGARRVVLVTDEVVGPLWGEAAAGALQAAGVEVARVTVAAGEARKDVDAWWAIVDGALRAGLDRATPLVALGGGVLGDLAGFAAASLLRGVPLVMVPTTTLSMIDSAVGGKTGFNHPLGKNLVGAFHQPALVWAPLRTLTTLPAAEVRAGLAEAVKVALFTDAALFARLERDAALLGAGVVEGQAAAALGPVIAGAMAAKARVVAADEREAGVRAVLNAGHSLGHAVETVLGHGAVRHGEAVAIGLVAELRWAEAEGLSPAGIADRAAALLEALGLPTAWPAALRGADEAVRAVLARDKKASAAGVVFPVLDGGVGRARLRTVPVDGLMAAARAAADRASVGYGASEERRS